MEYVIRKVRDQDGRQIVAIFNHFVAHSFAAYPQRQVDLAFFDRLVAMSRGLAFLVLEVEGTVIGFGLVSRYHSAETFAHTGVLTYFILPEHTRRGLGSRLLDELIQEAKARGMDNLLANISSKNEQSLNFHKKHGFQECGRMPRIGTKFDQPFDVVWMQKRL